MSAVGRQRDAIVLRCRAICGQRGHRFVLHRYALLHAPASRAAHQGRSASGPSAAPFDGAAVAVAGSSSARSISSSAWSPTANRVTSRLPQALQTKGGA